MQLWKLPKAEETAQEVDRFLRVQVKRLSRLAGVDLTMLSSPQFSQASVGHGGGNGTEAKMMRGLEAMEALQAIRYAMKLTGRFNEELLTKLYIEELPVWRIRQDLYINHDSFRKVKRRALLEFADAWKSVQDKYNWDDEDRIDLHVY